MKLASLFVFLAAFSAFAGDYQLCQSKNGEIEFVVAATKDHLFLAPHSFYKSQRQIASLETGDRNNIDLWEPIVIDSAVKIKQWRHDYINFTSDLKRYVEISDRDGKSASFSLTCHKL